MPDFIVTYLYGSPICILYIPPLKCPAGSFGSGSLPILASNVTVRDASSESLRVPVALPGLL